MRQQQATLASVQLMVLHTTTATTNAITTTSLHSLKPSRVLFSQRVSDEV